MCTSEHYLKLTYQRNMMEKLLVYSTLTKITLVTDQTLHWIILRLQQ